MVWGLPATVGTFQLLTSIQNFSLSPIKFPHVLGYSENIQNMSMICNAQKGVIDMHTPQWSFSWLQAFKGDSQQ